MFKPILPQIPAATLANLSPEARENMTAICNLVDFILGGLNALCVDLLDPENHTEAANTGTHFRELVLGFGKTLLIPMETTAAALFNREEFLGRSTSLGAVGRETLAVLEKTGDLQLPRELEILASLSRHNPN